MHVRIQIHTKHFPMQLENFILW